MVVAHSIMETGEYGCKNSRLSEKCFADLGSIAVEVLMNAAPTCCWGTEDVKEYRAEQNMEHTI